MGNRLCVGIFLLIVCFSCRNKTVVETYNDGRKKLECEFSEGKRNGECIEYYSNGLIKSKCQYKNDLLDGECEFYHSNGTIHWRVNFNEGNKTGEVQYYDSLGRKFQTSNFKNNKLNGLSLAYYEDGTLERKMTYKNDKLDGLFESFFRNGKIEVRAKYRKGVQIDHTSYDSLGNIVDHLIRYDINRDIEKNEIRVRILNPLYDVMGLKIVDKKDGKVEEEFFSEKYQIEYKINPHHINHKDTLRGYLLDIDTLQDGRGVVKSSIYFEYKLNKNSTI